MKKNLKEKSRNFLKKARRAKRMKYFQESRARLMKNKKQCSTVYELDGIKDQQTDNDIRHRIFGNLLNEHFDRVVVEGDGNCMYNSLILSYGLDYGHMTLRKKVKDFIVNHYDYFAAIDYGEMLPEFLQKILNDREWGTTNTLYAFSLMFNCQILIFSKSYVRCPFMSIYKLGELERIRNNHIDFQIIFLEYGHNHYNSLIPVNNLAENFELIKDIEYAYVDFPSENDIENTESITEIMPALISEKCKISIFQMMMDKKFLSKKTKLKKWDRQYIQSFSIVKKFIYIFPEIMNTEMTSNYSTLTEHSSNSSSCFSKKMEKMNKEKRKMSLSISSKRKDKRKNRKRKDT